MTDRAWEYLTKARASRASGDFDGCVRFACVAAYHAERDRLPEILYHSHACVGRAHLLRNEPVEARGWFRNACEVATEYDLEWRAPAIHDLFLCYRETDPPQAQRLANRAVQVYGESHPHLKGFLADYCVFREPMSCRWTRFPPLLTHHNPETVRIIALSNLMEAAAFEHETHRLVCFWNSLADVLRGREGHEGSALTLLTAARTLMGSETKLEGYAATQWCLSLAESRGEDKIADEARHLLSLMN